MHKPTVETVFGQRDKYKICTSVATKLLKNLKREISAEQTFAA
jgi:ribosomal protein S25